MQSRHLQYSWLEGQSTLRSEDQAAALLLEVEEEGEEVEVTKQMPHGGVLVPAVRPGEAIKMVVTTAEQEAVMLYNRAKGYQGMIVWKGRITLLELDRKVVVIQDF